MDFVDKFATYLALSIKKNHPESSSVAVLRYSLIALINQLITMSAVLLICGFFGHAKEALAASLAFPFLRNFSGGFHIKSSNLCNLITSIFIIISVYAPINYWYNGFILNILCILILLRNAPSGIKRNTLGEKHYPKLKWISIMIVSSNFIFHSDLLAATFFIQSLTTFPVLQRMLDARTL